ncbi:AGAP008545-PA-like protein [Anopheles sinensis]|uniref:AGAP008545-PA-like protein n=1 Tax=Anopheles sinensis TaxID=74873 RepID=A0A084VU30_ANOSI|nr:AGAP008545-PA-like protein [Anopheles sinensis]
MSNYQATYDAASRTWEGPTVKAVFNPEASIGQVIFEVLNRSSDRLVQIDMDTGRSMTYAEFKTRMVRFAQNLTAIGVGKGDVVALANANSENLGPLVCALLSIGAPFNALSPNFNEDDMAHMLGTTKPKLVFCDANNFDVVRSAVTRMRKGITPPIYVFEDKRDDVQHAEELLKETGQEDTFMPHYLGDSRKTLAAILCSSGTSGAHKGVNLSHASLMKFEVFFTLHHPKNSPVQRVYFNFSAIYWVTGVLWLVNVLINGDVRLFTRNGFNEEQFFEAAERYNAAFVFTPPAYANAILCHPRIKTVDLRSIKFWLIGGSMVPEDLRDRVDALLPNGRSLNAFGSSECGLVATDFGARIPDAIGMLYAGIRARVIDELGNRLGVGERGEFLLKPEYPFLGYYGNKAATANSCDDEGYFRTGDIGYIDENGTLYLVDRLKDIFKYKNFHVTPSELEMLIRKIDGVQEVSVVGVPDADRVTDLPAALIVKNPGSDLDAQIVHTVIDSQVSDFKRLRGGVHFINELPKTISGKVLRREVVEIIKQRNNKH